MKKGIIFVIVLTAFLTFFAGCGSSDEIDLNQYLSISYSGSDGDGQVDKKFDKSRFVEENADKVKYNESAAKSYGVESPYFSELSNEDLAEFIVMELINCDIAPDRGLSKGDTVNVTWDCPDDMIKDVFGLNLKHENYTDTVQGLGGSSEGSNSSNETYGSKDVADLEEVDPFEDLKVEFSGIDGNGEVEIGPSHFSGVDFQVFPETGLSNGETVKVSVKPDDPFFASHNMKPSITEKEYIVEGLESFKLSESDLNDRFKDELFKYGSKAAIEFYLNGYDYQYERAGMMNEHDVFWKYGKEYDEEGMKLKGILLANAKDQNKDEKNVVYGMFEMPYKITVVDNAWDSKSKSIGKVLGEGITLISVKYMNVSIQDGIPVFVDYNKEAEYVKDFSDIEVSFSNLKSDFTLVIEEHDDNTSQVESSSQESNTTDASVIDSDKSKNPFYGVWCSSSKDKQEAQKVADQLVSQGFDGYVYVTSDWSKLNSEEWYVVTAAVCSTETEAKSVLKSVREAGYTEAYVKYTGDYKGN